MVLGCPGLFLILKTAELLDSCTHHKSQIKCLETLFETQEPFKDSSILSDLACAVYTVV